MASLPRALTGTYDGRPFVLIRQSVHREGNEYIRKVDGYLIEFENDDVKYILEDDPLLKFDPIELKDLIPYA